MARQRDLVEDGSLGKGTETEELVVMSEVSSFQVL